MHDLRDLLKHEIEDLYSAEEQIIEALPLMIENAGNKNLKQSLNQHLKVTQQQKKRLDQVMKLMNEGSKEGEKKKGIMGLFGGGKHVCKGMKGIIEEGNKIMGANIDPEVRDAAIIASAQKVEHYEICGYGTARSYAEELQLTEVEKLLKQTLDEEYEADILLTELAETRVNLEAESASGGNRTGAGSSRARETNAERILVRERQMEPVSTKRNTSTRSRSGSSEGSGRPASSASQRNTGGRPSTSSSRKPASNTRSNKSGRR